MIWVIFLIFAVIVSSYLYGRHRSGGAGAIRTEQENQYSKYVEESEHSKNNKLGSDSIRNDDSPSQLNADLTTSVNGDQAPEDASNPPASTVDISSQETHNDTMDFTAETATLTEDEVGLAANSHKYHSANKTGNDQSVNDTDSSITEGVVAANAETHDQKNAHEEPTAVEPAPSAKPKYETIKGFSATNNYQRADDARRADANSATSATAVSAGVIAETVESIDEFDESQDFGDLTADISEMLKELNLRESDSPRLDLNEQEYQQLKTGEPGEVKHEKIEVAADKLRDMLL